MQRSDRIGDEIKRVVAVIIQKELRDPRIPNILSVLHVKVSRDLSHAHIFLSMLGSEAEKKDCVEALEKAKGFIRRSVGQSINLRLVPELHFIMDDSIEKAFVMDKLITEVRKQDVEKEKEKEL